MTSIKEWISTHDYTALCKTVQFRKQARIDQPWGHREPAWSEGTSNVHQNPDTDSWDLSSGWKETWVINNDSVWLYEYFRSNHLPKGRLHSLSLTMRESILTPYRATEDSLFQLVEHMFDRHYSARAPNAGRALRSIALTDTSISFESFCKELSRRYGLDPRFDFTEEQLHMLIQYSRELAHLFLRSPNRVYTLSDNGNLLMIIGLSRDMEHGDKLILKGKELEQRLNDMPANERERLLQAVRYETCDVDRMLPL